MSTIEKIFALAFYTANNDLSKRWCVRIKVPNYKTGCLDWKKCYGDVNKYNTIEKRLAALELLALEIKANQGYQIAPGSRIPGYVNESFQTSAIFQFKKQLEYRKYSIKLSTYRRYCCLLKNLEFWLGKFDRPKLAIGMFTNDDAHEFLKWIVLERGLSNESHNQHLRILKSLCGELVNQGIIKINPFGGIRGMCRQSVPAMYYTKAQTDVLKHCISKQDPQLWLFVSFIYYVFIRPGELRQLLISDINFHDGRIRMRPEITKNKKLQYVSIPCQLQEALRSEGYEKYPNNFYVFGKNGTPGTAQLGINSMKLRHQSILKKEGFSSEHKLYSWKHTGAIACARAGMPLKDLQMQLRHHSLDQVNTYLANMLVWESEFIKNKYPTL